MFSNTDTDFSGISENQSLTLTLLNPSSNP